MSKDCFEYKITTNVNDKIPDYFWAAFAGELCAVFGKHILEKVKAEDGSSYYLQYDTGTAGWHEAFKAACQKTDCGWLYMYYAELNWMESDQFDDEIANMVVENFIEADHSGASSYYLYLRSKIV